MLPKGLPINRFSQCGRIDAVDRVYRGYRYRVGEIG